MAWSREEIERAGLHEFVEFCDVMWRYLGLPPLTPIQREICWYLQHGPSELVLEAFRGAGKTWITAAFAIWNLFLDPQYKVLIVSASQTYGDQIATFIKRLIDEIEILQWLSPRPEQRHSAIAFDVAPASPTPTPSVSSVGIGGQLTGKRPDLIISDDVEVPKNSFTHLLRQKLREQVKEYSALRRPKKESPNAKTVYLGTPQTEETIYNILEERGYTIVVWPAQVPAYPAKYHGRLGPIIQRMIDHGVPAGTPTEPNRFDETELLSKRAEYGMSGYSLQFMLDPSPADADKFPLKTGDLVVTDVDSDLSPIRYVWSRLSEYVLQNLASGGFDGDCWRRPSFVSPEVAKYQGTVMGIDPSGRGRDETGYAIVRYNNGLQYLVASGGFTDGTSDTVLAALAALCIQHRVSHIAIEPNFGDGMFGQLLKPVLVRSAETLGGKDAITPQIVEDFRWSTGQKEIRILNVLEPLTQSHKLVIDHRVIEIDMQQQAEKPAFSLVYQMTHITRDKGALGHDDRIEALAIACEYWVDRMARDQEKQVERHKKRLEDKELRRIIEIHSVGGTLYIDNRIGHEQDHTPRRTVQRPTGNSRFNLNRNR